MFALHCTTCDATYLMGASAIAAALASASAIETPSGTVVDVLCPFGHVNTTGFNARIDAGRGTGGECGLGSGAARQADGHVSADRSTAARLAV